MTDQRSDNLGSATVDPAGMAIDPEQVIPPEQPPMDGAAGGPQADPEQTRQPDKVPLDEQIAAELGDFA